MFESAELGHTIDKDTYETEVPKLREALLDAQFEMVQQAQFPVIILVGGVDGAGKGSTINLLNEWMDPRHIQVYAFDEPTEGERARPPMWRYWRALPPKGKVGIFFGSWYTDPIVRCVMGKEDHNDLEAHIDVIRRFERMLIDEGALIIKLWFHLPKKVQKKRLKKLEEDKRTRWRVTVTDWEHFNHYDEFRRISEHVLRETSVAAAPWIVIEGSDFRYRNLTTGEVLLEAIRKRLDHPAPPPAPSVPPLQSSIDHLTLFDKLDMSQKLSKKEYHKQLDKYQGQLNLLTRDPRFKELSLMAVFEGSDAVGKGGAIRRISAALDARYYRIIPIAAPTDEERAHPYMWRFWRHVPRPGRVTIFDRSWYGRVLVERVEGFCSEADWMRAYREINDFEEQLADHNTIILKFWLTITREEQLARFKAREEIGFKRFKITDEDWRNREKWEEYERAVCDMIDRTSTDVAPWMIVEANDKRFARIKVLKALCERIEQAFEGRKKKK
jgi:polyphosphate:AMP phosphotransferase